MVGVRDRHCDITNDKACRFITPTDNVKLRIRAYRPVGEAIRNVRLHGLINRKCMCPVNKTSVIYRLFSVVDCINTQYNKCMANTYQFHSIMLVLFVQ